MAHDVEQRVTKSGEFGAWLVRAAATVLQHYAVILWMIAALTIVYLVLLPPCEDVITGLAWADLEALQGHFPISLSDLWLSRGIGYKTFLYLAEGLSRFIAGDALRGRTDIFNAIFIALALGVLLGAYHAFLLRRDPVEVRRFSLRDRAETLAVAALCVVPAVIWSWTQDAHISVLLCVLGIGLALSPSVRAQWCSGVVLILLFSIKGVTALDFLFVIATAFATGEAARIRRIIIGAAMATVATGLAYATILRTELENILLGAQFEQPAHLGRFLKNGVQFAVYNPVIPIALVVLAAALGAGLTRKNPRLVGFAIFIWLVPLASLFAQHEFFGYHYQGFVLSSWLCLMALYLAKDGHWPDFFAIRSAPPLAKIFVILVCCVNLAAIGMSLLTPNKTIYSRTVVEHRLDCWVQITKQARSLILTADPGLAENGAIVNLTRFTYGLELRSALRFFFPLPLQNQNLGTQASKDYVRSIVEYNGPAVIAYAGMMKLGDEGFGPIVQHLRADYRPVLVLLSLCEDVRNSGAVVWMRANN
jgi:hypothetical protein